MNEVRRPALIPAIALAALFLQSILDLGPRAEAAYQSIAIASVSDGCAIGEPSDSTPADPTRVAEKASPTAPALHVPGSSGGMSSPPGSGSSSGASPGVAHLLQVERPASVLVVYVRESAAALDLTAYSDSILDPPRLA